jgi:hypothetical protein
MNDILSWGLMIGLGLGCLACALPPSSLAEGFPLTCTVDYRAPIPPELLNKAGIQGRRVCLSHPQGITCGLAAGYDVQLQSQTHKRGT